MMLGSSKVGLGQLLYQDFTSSTVVADYVSPTPTNEQFNAVSSSGTGTVISINENNLQFSRTGNAGSFSRTTDFSPVPSTLIYKIDISVSGNTAAQTTAAVFQVGSGFGTANSTESNDNTYARFAINFTETDGTFAIRDITNGNNSENLSGKQSITWVLNNSGSTVSYLGPDDEMYMLYDDRTDIWAGTTKLFNGVEIQTPTQSITDLKFAFTAGTGTISIDMIHIDPIQVSGPIFNITPSYLSDLFYLEDSGPSTPQSFELNGLNLDGTDVTVTAPANFEVSTSETGTYGSSVTLTAFDGTATDIWVRLAAGLSVGEHSGIVAITGGGASQVNVAVSGEVITPPPGLPYSEDFSEFETLETLPHGWSLDDNYAYQGDFGSGTAGGLRGNGVLGFQLTGSAPNNNFTASLELLNNTGSAISELILKYTGKVERVDPSGTPKWVVSVQGVETSELEYATLSGVDREVIYIVRGLSIAAGNSFTIEWFTTSTGTSGTRRQIGITDVMIYTEFEFADLSDPGSIDAEATLVIDGTAILSAPLEVKNLIIENPNSLIINPDGRLKINEALNNPQYPSGILIKSDDTGTGSLIHNTPGVEATVERYIPMSRGTSWEKYEQPTEWFYISSPVSGQSIAGFLDKYTNYDLYRWDESIDKWLNYSANGGVPDNAFAHESFEPLTGYLFAAPEANMPECSGTLFAGDATWSNLSRSGLANPDPGKTDEYYDAGWHLLGNPYASGIVRRGWSTTGFVATPKIWMDGGYVDVANDQFIPSMTGFMMQVDTGNDGNNTLTIPASAREHTGTLPTPPGEKSEPASIQTIRLIAKAPESSVQQQSIIMVQPESDQSFDPRFDSRFLQGHAPVLYSLKSSERLSTHAVNTIHPTLTIPFAFIKNDEGPEFRMELSETIPGITPYLYDRKEMVEHLLTADTPYAFIAEADDEPLRFELRFSARGDGPTSVPEMETLPARIFANQQTLTIEQYDATGERTLEVFDLSGRVLMQQRLDASPQHHHQLNLNPGIYVVRLSSSQSVQIERIILTR